MKWRNRSISFYISMLWMIGLILGAILARFNLFGHSEVLNVENVYVSPNKKYLFGTDSLGRDVLLRVLIGSGVSLFVAIGAVILNITIAIIFGSMAAWFFRQWDWFWSLILEIWMGLPAAVLASVLSLIFLPMGSSIVVVCFLVGVTHWGRLAKLLRAEIFRLSKNDFLEVSKLLGGSPWHQFVRHLLPHLRPLISVYAIYQIPYLILAESFLSFVGVGVQPPETSWGLLIQEGWRSMAVAPHVVFFPALFLFFTVFSLNSLIERESR